MPRALLFITVVAASASLSCTGEETRVHGIVLLVEAAPDSLDPRFALTASGQRVAQLITPGLMTFDARGLPVPELAETFRHLDARTLEFKLRSNLRFHDGSSLTSADVAATYAGLVDPAVGSPRGGRLEVVEEVVTPDERTVVVRLKRPYAPVLAELSIGILPAERAHLPAQQSAGLPVIGAGAFRVVSAEDPERVELAPFEGYWRGPPAIPRLIVRTVRDETTRVLELLKGRADLVVNATSPAVLPVVASSGAVRIQTVEGSGYAYVAFNLRGGPTADVRVRQAVCHAIDVEALVTHKLKGLATPAHGMLPTDHWAYTETPRCERDLAKAAALLDAAGFPDPDGPGGQPRLRLSYKTSSDRGRRSTAVVLQKQLAEAGIALDVRALEFGTFFGDIRKGNFELMMLKWASVLEPDLLRGVYSSKNVPTEANHFAGWNRGAYANAEVDALLERAVEAADPGERKALYARVLQQLAADLPYVPLYHEHGVCLVSRHLEDYACSPHGFFTPLSRARYVGAPR